MDSNLHQHFVTQARRFSRPLAREVAALGPLSLPDRRAGGLAQFLARVIVGQQLSTTAARSIWVRLQATAREAGSRVPAYCVPERYESLRACGLSNNKVKALIAVQKARVGGLLVPARLRRMALDARAAALRSIHGVGPWTVDMVEMFYFREPDIWPLGDVAVRKTFGAYLAGQSKFDANTAAVLFAPHRSYLALYMWQLADATPPA